MVSGAELRVFGVCAKPADEQMHLVLAKGIAGDEAVIIPTNVEHDAVAAVTQQIGRAEGLLNISRGVSVGVF